MCPEPAVRRCQDLHRRHGPNVPRRVGGAHDPVTCAWRRRTRPEAPQRDRWARDLRQTQGPNRLDVSQPLSVFGSCMSRRKPPRAGLSSDTAARHRHHWCHGTCPGRRHGRLPVDGCRRGAGDGVSDAGRAAHPGRLGLRWDVGAPVVGPLGGAHPARRASRHASSGGRTGDARRLHLGPDGGRPRRACSSRRCGLPGQPRHGAGMAASRRPR